MFDFSFAELALIGVVGLVVLGPERLPKVARTVGEWAGKAQRYVSQVKADINREVELSELKKLQDEAREAASSIQNALQTGVVGLESGLQNTANELNAAANASRAVRTGSDPLVNHVWEHDNGSWRNLRFDKRYKPGPSVDDLVEELAKLKRQLALRTTSGAGRKFAPRARINRPRIRR